MAPRGVHGTSRHFPASPERLGLQLPGQLQGILHPMIKFIEKQLKPFFCMFLLSDVGASAKPSSSLR
jgi:hypothetical protein